MRSVLSLLLGALLLVPARADEEAHTAWLARVPARLQKDPAFAYVVEDARLPRVLLLGDSISIGYTAGVRDRLRGQANVLRIPANGGSTKDGLEHVDEWLGAGPWAVIHFNWGLHDLKHWQDGKLDNAGPQVCSVEAYENNLRALVARLRETKAALVWASTTPVPEGTTGREANAENAYNEAAARIMAESGIPIDDLHATVLSGAPGLQLPRNVHFTPEGSKVLAEKVVACIAPLLHPSPAP